MSSMKRGWTCDRPAPMKLHPCVAIVAGIPRLVLEHVQRPGATHPAVRTLPRSMAATTRQRAGMQAVGVAL